jgi:putative hydrolase of the HAD superfamily
MVAAHAVTPATTAFFEDTERNLKPAADLGMTTVLVGAHGAASTADFVHYRTSSLPRFLLAAQVKESRP